MSRVSDMDQEIQQRLIDGCLPCMVAFSIAEELGVSPRDVADAANRSDIRISSCQLGLFGYHAFGRKRFIAPLARVPDRLAAALHEACKEGKLPCAAAQRIAKEEGLPMPVIGSAAEALKIRLVGCELGCF